MSPPGDAKAVVLSKQTVYAASADNPKELLCVLPVLCCGERPATSLLTKLQWLQNHLVRVKSSKHAWWRQRKLVYLEKRRTFANISLTRNIIADRVCNLSVDLDSQLKNKVQAFIAFSVAIDESTDLTDVAQLAIFVCSLSFRIFKKPLSVLWLIVMLCLSYFLTVLKQKSKQSDVAVFKLHTIILLVRPAW